MCWAGDEAIPFPASYSYASSPIEETNLGASKVDFPPASLKASLFPPGPKKADIILNFPVLSIVFFQHGLL